MSDRTDGSRTEVTLPPATSSGASAAKVFHLGDLPVDRVGGTYRMAALRGDDCTVGLHWFRPDHPAWPAPHSHPYDQLAFVIKGSMRFTLGDETRDVEGPAVVWIPADMPHSADVIGGEPCFNLDVFGLVREDFAHLFPGDDAAAHVVPFDQVAPEGTTD